ncbi:MAG: S-methyl-5'-thioadenosine phosphorylase [Candidatus Omnitrophica bacterium]|nr:S-methyl-5'-thioadenosine phosphorylase [Candidatus Omnitrophota bacterium]MBU4303371.1 S-methyl-5'-thioadenosine phosphorylase [Candidatus Omnitrophota bacterium]MBU4418473.1 S-methyl-5'-thioadenosine phosphorylase [Candidatus Omnitrophota bacterium]MBU4467565.1 S-methyl-5'-thioadenosine phosphorylase [Candidatus Omnitrophota bacterium]MCG2707242.1 S-methyl-5'-thioadenosine phosphorylase [Candidatus Omnitrophota bacterium]
MSGIGIIGGSGLYKIEGLEIIKQLKVKTPFGEPSDKFTIGKLEGKEVVFLPRHGVGHRISPSEINYRANIFAMKKLGVQRIISVTACGSLKEELKPLDFVVVDQFVDRTNHGRQMTFFDRGMVSHIVFSHPVCPQLSLSIYAAGKSLNLNMHKTGTYLNMEGPQFSTLAESKLYCSWGMDIIGMTNLAEAKLCREAEICYSTLACITDYDCWHPDCASVTLEMVMSNLQKNVDNAKKILCQTIKGLSSQRSCSCGEALKFAIVTDRKLIPLKVKRDLNIIIGKYVK